MVCGLVYGLKNQKTEIYGLLVIQYKPDQIPRYTPLSVILSYTGF